MQREFLVRHIKSSKIKRSYTTGDSWRKNTKEYSLGVGEEMKTVCKQYFFNTLGISEQMAKTALKKMTPTGTLENDKRGGRQSDADIERDQLIWKEISDHIDRFPRVESHYCRESSTREYVSSELSMKRVYNIYNMFIQEWMPRTKPPSLTIYKKVHKRQNLSIHHPKEDQCSLCVNYRKGTEEMKIALDVQNSHRRENKGQRNKRTMQESCKRRQRNTVC